MSGVAVLVRLFRDDAAVTALVDDANIVAGVLTASSGLPGISVMSVDQVDRNLPSPGAVRHVTERVQVTIMASKYPDGKAIKRAVKSAAADKRGTIAGYDDVVVLSLGAGPDFLDEDSKIVMQVQDFEVSFNEAA